MKNLTTAFALALAATAGAATIQMPSGCTTPDGMTIDPKGRFVIAAPNTKHDQPGAIYRIDAPGAEPALVRFPLPFLPAGPHRIRLVWDGIDPALGVCLHEAALETPGGPDENGDGLEDWVLAQSLALDSVPASVPAGAGCGLRLAVHRSPSRPE